MMWLRLYCDAIDNSKLRLLAFEDRWHYIAVLCLKGSGILDSPHQFKDRQIALKLGLQMAELEKVKGRLLEVDLITDDWQPTGWDERQFMTDHSGKERTRKWRRKQLYKKQ
ncbi:MAG: hypothetical protein MN733_42035 [Nitrososphaera sp.]|nr:hypothetical protein [Nitrososphaera sp.]